MEVTVADAHSRVAFQGATKANGTFATGDLRPGPYVVRFHSRRATVKGDQFMLILLAGKKPLLSNAVAGEKFTSPGGVAVKIDVAPGAKITGQVESARALARDKVKVVNGKRYFFVRETGSNLGGHWIAEDARGAGRTLQMNADQIRNIQNHSAEGSMNRNMHLGDLETVHR